MWLWLRSNIARHESLGWGYGLTFVLHHICRDVIKVSVKFPKVKENDSAISNFVCQARTEELALTLDVCIVSHRKDTTTVWYGALVELFKGLEVTVQVGGGNQILP